MTNAVMNEDLDTLLREQQEYESLVTQQVFAALHWSHSDEELRTLTRALNDPDMVDQINRVLDVRMQMRTDPAYWRAAVFQEIHLLSQEGRVVEPEDVWRLMEKSTATEISGRGTPLQPFFRRLRWWDDDAKAYRDAKKGTWLAVPRLVRGGADRQLYANGLDMLIPLWPVYDDLLQKLGGLRDKALESQIQRLTVNKIANIGEAVRWIGRLHRGARVMNAGTLERLYEETEGLWTKKDGGDDEKASLLFQLSSEENLLLVNDALGQRIHACLTEARAVTDAFWSGSMDQVLKEQMLAAIHHAPPAHIVPAESMLHLGSSAAGWALVMRPEWHGHADVWLLLQRGFDGRVSILSASPAGAAAEFATRELYGYTPRSSWHRDTREFLKGFLDGCEEVVPAEVARLSQTLGPRLLEAPPQTQMAEAVRAARPRKKEK